MAIRQPPSDIKDPNLRGFLQELRNAIGKTNEQVTRLIQMRSSSGGVPTDPGGTGDPTDPGGTGNPTDPPIIPKQATVVLTIDPARPTINNPFTLTATVTGDNPTGTVQFRQDGSLMTLDPVPLSSAVASVSTTLASKGTYTFVAEYSGDIRNLGAISNSLTVQFSSNWDGKPPAPSALSASQDDPFQITLRWSNPYIGDYAVTEVWGVKQNPPGPSIAIDDEDISNIAVKLGEVASTDYVLSQVNGVALDSGENWYFWVRNRDTENLVSDWNATAGTNGKTGIQPGKYLEILTGSITETQLFKNLGGRIEFLVPLETAVTGIENDITLLQNADIQLAQQISLVSAGSTGFDVRNIWYFGASSEITGWTSNQLTGFAVSAGNLVVNAATGATAPWFETAAFSDTGTYKTVLGSDYSDVHLRIKRTAGTGWLGRLTYTVSGGSTYTKDIAEPTYNDSDYGLADWELSSDTNWTGNTITKVRIQLGAGAGDNFLIDWMAVGRYAPGASAAQVADLASAQIGYCVISGSPTGHTSKSACEAAGGTWLGNYPLATAVKQVAVQGTPYCVINGEIDATKTTQSACTAAGGTWTDPGTAAIEQAVQALQKANGELYAQYTVKIDNNGYVSGFGLASEPVNGIPYSDFMVRADRFSISSPDYPTWRRTISSLVKGAGTSTTATCTTSTAHGYATGDTVIIRNAADGKWNGTFTITVPQGNTTQFTFTVDGTATTPAVAATGKSLYLTKVMMPFIVTTTSRDINGITVPPGVYIDSAYIAAATITEAQIRDAAITNAKISGFIQTAGWTGPTGPSGWKLDKNNSTVEIKGGFALYDDSGNPIITAGRINVQQFRRLILTAQPAEVFTIAKNTGTVSPSTISLIATLQNIGTGLTVTWTVTQGTYDTKTAGQTLRTDTNISTSTSLTVDPTKFGTGVTVVGFKATCVYDGVTYEDTFTIPKLAEGTDALYLHLTNENDSLPTNADGTFATGANKAVSSGVVIYRGSTNATSETSPTWTITASSNDANTTAAYSAGTVTVTMQNSSADRVLVTVTATRGSETATKVMTVTKQKQGAAGSSGVVIDLDNESHTVPTDSAGNNGNYAGCATTATLYLGASDVSASATWSAPSVVTGTVTGAATNGNRAYTVTAMSTDAATIRLRATYGGVNYDAVFTVTKAKGGADGTPATIYSLLPSVDAIKKSAAGAVTPMTINFTAQQQTGNGAPSAWTTAWIRFQTSTDGITFTDLPSNAVAQVSPSTGIRGWEVDGTKAYIRAQLGATSAVNPVLDQETIPVVADGATGANAKSVSLQVSGFVRTRAKDGTITPGILYITPNGSNLAGSPLLCYTYASPPPPLTAAPTPGADGNTTWAGWITSLGAKLRVNANATTAPSDSIIADGWWDLSKPKMAIGVWWDGLSDVVGLSEVTEGSDGLTVVLTNDNHTFTCNNSGAVTDSYVGSKCDIQVYEGSNLLAASSTATVSAFRVGTITQNPPASITVNAVTYSGNTATIPNYSGLSPSVDTVVLTVPITVYRSNGTSTVVSKTITLGKSKQGATGASAYSMILSNESHTIPGAANGTPLSYTGASCTATVYLGATPDSGWTFSGSPTSGSNLTYTTSGSTFTVTGMAAATDAAHIDITASKSGQTSITKRFSISKSKTGHTLSLSTTAQVIKGNSAVANVNVPPQFTITAATTGSVSNLIWEYSNSQTATPSWTSAGSLGASWTLGSGAGDGVAHFPEYNSIFLVRVTDTGTGISDVMTISRVVDGAPGAPGTPGAAGVRGSKWETVTGQSAWSDSVANTAVGGTPVVADIVTQTNGTSFSQTKVYTGTAWVDKGPFLAGNVVVQGSINVDKLNTQSAWASQITLANGTGNYLQSQNFVANTSGFRIDGSGNAEFYNVKVRGDVLLGGGNQIQNSEGLHGFTDMVTFAENWVGSAAAFLTAVADDGGYFSMYQPSGAYSSSNGYMYALVQRSGTAAQSRIAVVGGRKYQFSIRCRVSSALTMGEIYIDWHTGNTGSNWIGNSGTPISTTSTSSTTLAVIATAPENATHCVPVIRKRCPSGAGNTSFFYRNLMFAEVPDKQVSPIPWSPGGISLLDTLALRANAATVVEYVAPSGVAVTISAAQSGTITTSTGVATLPVATVDSTYKRLLTFNFELQHSDGDGPGYIRIRLYRNNTLVTGRFVDPPTRLLDTTSNTAISLAFTLDALANTAETFRVDVEFINISGANTAKWWGVNSNPFILYPVLTCFTSKR